MLSPEQRVLNFGYGWIANHHYFGYISQLFPSISLDMGEQAAFDLSTTSLQETVSFFRLKTSVSPLYAAVSRAHCSWHDREPLLSLSDEDVEWGESELSRICSEKVDWFVTFHVRTGGNVLQSGPNSNVADYIPAIRAVVENGGVAIRIGGPEMPVLPKIPGIVDYAHAKVRSPRMNTYLMAKCRFLVGTASGPLTVPHSFGVPVLYTNAPAVGLVPDFPRTLTLPRKYADKSSGRILHFDELVNSPAAWTVNPLAYSSLRAVPNTPEELRAAVLEMLHSTIAEPFLSTTMTTDQRTVHESLRHSVGEYSGVRIPNSYLSENKKYFVGSI